MVLDYAEGGSLLNLVRKNYEEFSWLHKIKALLYIIQGLKDIHQKQMVHRNFHTGNILVSSNNINDFSVLISDIGLSGEVWNNDETKIYGIIPYVAPEVLRGKPYTPAADIYSFSMVMYFIATGKQPFVDDTHDDVALAVRIIKGQRPEINESGAPKCYIDLMSKCWDSNPDNRPNASEIEESIKLFNSSEKSEEIKNQFKEAEEYRKANLKNKKPTQAIDSPPISPLLAGYDLDDTMKFDFTQ
jgi:serine/threonine protein kinase